MSEAVDWAVAERVAGRFAGREPFSQSYHYDSLTPDFVELTAAGRRGWSKPTPAGDPPAGDGPAVVADRQDWIRANIRSFQRMLRPLTERLEAKMTVGAFAPITGRVAGAEMGAVLGWMSHPGARPVRPAGARGRGPRRAGPRLLRRARTSSGSRSASGSRLASSGCGWRCTRSRTAPSSPACRGCGPTSCRS